MEAQDHPKPGQKWVHRHTHYEIVDVSDGIVRMENKRRKQNSEVEETLTRFISEAQAGRAIHYPDCTNCGLPIRPDMGRTDSLHYECWFEAASVKERCEAESDQPGGLQTIASEALRSDDPRSHLFDVIGDPARTLHTRIDAETLLSGAVPIPEILEASVKCPECGEGEAFEIEPATGVVSCHCGEVLKESG